MVQTAQKTKEVVPAGHIDDSGSVQEVLSALHELHADDGYRFSVNSWEGPTLIDEGKYGARYLFVIRAEQATVKLRPGDRARGPGDDDSYSHGDDEWGEVTGALTEEVWPGDSLVVLSGEEPLQLDGSGVYFSVETEKTDYPSPRLSMLRNLEDRPGGCAAYDRAFRRETIPPVSSDDPEDDRGANRVNQHTLDMRVDREPTPIRHYHGTVSVGPDEAMPNSEIALVLSRETYELPPFEGQENSSAEEGWIKIYNRPIEDPEATETISVTPGSIVVTPATSEQVYGHCFENTFAMLVAIPGFVAPYIEVEDESS